MRIAEMKASMEAARQQLKEHGQAAFKAELVEFFEKHPEVEAIKWTQYTPYFNDGDPCEFSVHDLTVKSVGATGEEGDDEDGFEYACYGDKFTSVNNWWGEVSDDDVLLAAFGDHVEITATRAGIEVDEYSHD